MYKVLLVDDEPMILEGMKLVIKWEELGLEIAATATNGVAALEAMDLDPIDILITDIKMPVMNGIDLLRITRTKFPNVKVIILSGHDDFEYVKEAARFGIENYLLKPVDEEELLSTLLLVTNKLDSENTSNQRRRQDISIIRENILLRWVTNSISPAELEKRVDLLDINARETDYTACVIHCARPARLPENEAREIAQRNRAVITGICAGLISEKTAYLFSNLDGDVVLLFHCLDKSPGYDCILKILSNCLQSISRSIDAGVCVLVGSVQTGYENVHRSYADAQKLMEYTMIQTGSHIIEHNRTVQENDRLDMEVAIDFDGLKKLILDRDLAGAERFLDDVYGQLAGHPCLSPVLLRSTTVRIGLFIINAVSMAKANARGTLDGADVAFADAWERKSLEELKSWVKGVAASAIDFLLSADRSYSPIIKKVVQFINTNYDKEIALKSISGSLNMNPVYLGQLFKTETGEMFTAYLNNRRIEEAKKLLLSTKMNVVDIGVKVGYSNNNHFFSVFKKLLGVSPTEYRRMNNPLKM